MTDHQQAQVAALSLATELHCESRAFIARLAADATYVLNEREAKRLYTLAHRNAPATVAVRLIKPVRKRLRFEPRMSQRIIDGDSWLTVPPNPRVRFLASLYELDKLKRSTRRPPDRRGSTARGLLRASVSSSTSRTATTQPDRRPLNSASPVPFSPSLSEELL